MAFRRRIAEARAGADAKGSAMTSNVKTAAVALALLAAGCAPTTRQAPAPRASTPQVYTTPQLQELIGSSAAQLVARFGEPRLDIREGTARKLQFVSPACVLDVYFYPSGTREPVVTHIDARLPDGNDFDRSSCIAALTAARQVR
jgi:hypothetical protein